MKRIAEGRDGQAPVSSPTEELQTGSPHFSVPGADEGPFHADNVVIIDQVEHMLHPADVEQADATEELDDEENNSHYSTTKISSWRNVGLVTGTKHVVSLALTFFCIVVVSAAIFTEQTTATGEKDVHPIFAFIVFWVLLAWLALMEGALNCMVGLKPIDKGLFVNSHVKAHKCTTLAHQGDNLERFIVGRQYLDLMVVFLTSFMVSTIEDASVLGLPQIVNNIFLDSGLAVILITIIFGQLIAQINAAHSMLDYMNNWPMLATTYAALTVEASGILHAVYLVQIFFARLSGKPIESSEPVKTTRQKFFFWARVVMSVSILVASFVVALTALFQGNTTMWSGVPPTVSLILLIALIGVVGLMEGLQIALFAVVHLPPEQLDQHALAKYNCDLIFHQSPLNLESFLVGRQICQTVIMFGIARITTVEMEEGEGNLFGVGDGLQAFFDTGVLGALLSTIVASLSWRVIASSFPMVFLANPLSTMIVRFCLAIEWTGVCYSSWFFAHIHQRIVGFKNDEVYIGSIDDRHVLPEKEQPGTPASSSTDHSDHQEEHNEISRLEGRSSQAPPSPDREETPTQ